MRTLNPYIKNRKELRIEYSDETRIGLLTNGAVYNKMNITITGETWDRFNKVWQEFYKGMTADAVMEIMLLEGIGQGYFDVMLGEEHDRKEAMA